MRPTNRSILLNSEAIQSHIDSPQLIKLDKIEIFESLTSTNDYFINQKNISNTTVNRACLAEMQTKGRGQKGRTWFSPFAKNIYLSLLWHFSKEINELSGLSLAAATAVLKTLALIGLSENLGVKWPNDVLWKQHKLAGLLIETNGEMRHTTRTIIGVGLNVQMNDPLDNKLEDNKNVLISKPWVDIQTILKACTPNTTTQQLNSSKTPLDRNLLAGLLINELIKTFSLFEEQGFKPFIPYWQANDLALNKEVSMVTNTETISGKGKGINEKGHYLVEMPNGALKNFATGEVSLKLV